MLNQRFTPRDCAGALEFNNKMWILGGWNTEIFPQATTSEIWVSSDGYHWALAAIAPWEGRHCAGFVVHDGKIWVVGGDNNRGYYQNDVWYSSDGINWTLATDDVPWRDRATHSVLVFDNKIWVLGSQQIQQFGGGNDTYNDVWYSTDGVTWSPALERAPWSPRGQILGSVVFNEKMWVLGGGTYNGSRQYFNDIWSSPDGTNWTLVNPSPPWQPRQYHNVIVFDGKIWVLGGYNETDLNSVWYSSNGEDWYQLPVPPWVPRHAGSTVVFNNSLWMIAGSSNGSVPIRDVWKLTIPE